MTDKNRTERTIKQGVGGAILGAVIGAPGLGMALGMLNANKDKIQQTAQQVDKTTCQQKRVSEKKSKRAMDDPAGYFFR